MRVNIITGNVGAGKTTLLRYIKAAAEEQSRDDVRVIFEAVDKRTYFIKRYYADPKSDSNAFLVHCDVFSHYFSVTKQLYQIAEDDARDNTHTVVFVEGSPHDVLHVFIAYLNNHGYTTETETTTLRVMFEKLCLLPVWLVAGAVMVEATPEECVARSAIRSRAGEASIDMAYVQELHELYSRPIVPTTTAYVQNRGSTSSLHKIAKQLLGGV